MSEGMRPLDGKVALVTGASSGIGEATAIALAEAGAAVAVGARRRDRLDALTAKLRGDGARVLALEQGSADVVNVSSVAGRTARRGAGVYNASKWAVNAFSESLRQEVTARGVRVSLVEPGAVATELSSHITQDAAREASQRNAASMRTLQSEDIARAIRYVVSQPPHVAINEVLVRPTDQER